MSTLPFFRLIRLFVATFRRDERGSVHISEIILAASILSIGGIVGLSAFRNAVVTEYSDLAVAISSLNQSFSYQIYNGTTTTTVSYSDTTTPQQPVSVVGPTPE
jgi:hypothetical protein